MTNEEAREILRQIRKQKCVSECDYSCPLYESKTFCLEEEALDHAIKALEAQPTKVDETYLSIKDAISELKAQREHIVGYMSVVGTTAYDMGIEALETTCIEDYPTCTECEHYDREKHYCPRFCQVIKDTLAEAQPCISILNRIMEYTYGMLTAEKYGLQHLIKSMMDEMSGGGEDEDSD